MGTKDFKELNMEFDDFMKNLEVQKAPDGFTDRTMIKLKPSLAKQKSGFSKFIIFYSLLIIASIITVVLLPFDQMSIPVLDNINSVLMNIKWNPIYTYSGIGFSILAIFIYTNEEYSNLIIVE